MCRLNSLKSSTKTQEHLALCYPSCESQRVIFEKISIFKNVLNNKIKTIENIFTMRNLLGEPECRLDIQQENWLLSKILVKIIKFETNTNFHY